MPILYIVATPIGNLKDISLRALEVLKEADLIVCEDTRQTLKLLNHYQITKPLISYFQHSKLSKIDYIIEQLKQGKKVALVTDAGTPGISDPGGKLIELITNHLPLITVSPIPGPNAAISALSVSGFPADKFVFLGFPPHKKGREKFFREVAEAKYTVVFYESTYRITKTLNKLIETQNLTDRQIVVCRELTKTFESVYRGTAQEVLSELNKDRYRLKGEFVIIIHGS